MFSAKKSLYLFLTALMGMLLFLVIHRLIVFAYLMLLYYNYPAFSFGLNLFEFMLFDYITLIMSLLFGMWYGIWLGQGWFEAVYEGGGHSGFFGHILRHYFPIRHKNYELGNKVSTISRKLEIDLMQLEELNEEMARRKPVVKVAARKVVRKKTR